MKSSWKPRVGFGEAAFSSSALRSHLRLCHLIPTATTRADRARDPTWAIRRGTVETISSPWVNTSWPTILDLWSLTLYILARPAWSPYQGGSPVYCFLRCPWDGVRHRSLFNFRKDLTRLPSLGHGFYVPVCDSLSPKLHLIGESCFNLLVGWLVDDFSLSSQSQGSGNLFGKRPALTRRSNLADQKNNRHVQFTDNSFTHKYRHEIA